MDAMVDSARDVLPLAVQQIKASVAAQVSVRPVIE